jgi:hypothetical protein
VDGSSAAVALAAALDPSTLELGPASARGDEVILLTGRNVDPNRLLRTLGPSPVTGTC